MSQSSRPIAACGILLLLQLGGCASQPTAVADQNEPLRSQIAQLNQLNDAMIRKSHEQYAALNQALAAVRQDVAGLRSELANALELARSGQEKATQAELRLDELYSRQGDGEAALDALHEQVGKFELRLDQLASEAEDTSALLEDLEERLQKPDPAMPGK